MARKLRQTKFTHRATVVYSSSNTKSKVLLYATPKFWTDGEHKWRKDRTDPFAQGDEWHYHCLQTDSIVLLTPDERAAQTEAEHQTAIQKAKNRMEWAQEQLEKIRCQRIELDQAEQRHRESVAAAEKALKELGA